MMPFHSTTIFTLAHLLPLSLAHLPRQKHHLNLLSSITIASLRTETINDSVQLINLLSFLQYCFLSHLTQRYPQLRCLSTQPPYSHQHICFPYHLLIFHNKKHHLNLLSSITITSLTHTLASFWRKQSCLVHSPTYI